MSAEKYRVFESMKEPSAFEAKRHNLAPVSQFCANVTAALRDLPSSSQPVTIS
jgi:hypothetical protein